MKGMVKLGLTLALYATAACVGLALVYSATSETIAQRQQADLQSALRELFPQGDEFTDMTGTLKSPDPGVSFETQYAIRGGATLLGVAIQASTPSYGGNITVLVGVGVGGAISRVKILSHQDTPGLGANAASPTYYVDKAAKLTFSGQFGGKAVSDPFVVKEDVAAITASTITSRAVATAVKAVADAGAAWFASQKEGL
ncbi:MAG: FMN-binding protein [Spirochaetaceae bacterium]|jgi:electron transport complex protein RnfG|nr:FMN-binding protein [Spirochaetaceae bacterium]